MAAELRLSCGVGGYRIGLVSGSHRGDCTLFASSLTTLHGGSSVRSPGCFSSVEMLSWRAGKNSNSFWDFDSGSLEKKWKKRPMKLGLSGIHAIDARCDTGTTGEVTNGVNGVTVTEPLCQAAASSSDSLAFPGASGSLELLHSRDSSQGMASTSGDPEEEWKSNSTSSSGTGTKHCRDINDGEGFDNISASRQDRGNESKGAAASSYWWSFGDSIDKVLHLPNGFEQQVEMLYEKLGGCRLASQELLLRVLVHRSYYEANMPVAIRDQRRVILYEDSNPSTGSEARSNLALVGDALLNLVTSQSLILEHPFQPTGGEVTQRRSQLVCNSNLRRVWSSLGLDHLPLTNLPVSLRKGKDSQSNLHADTFEALIGALVNEKGLKFAEDFVTAHVLPLLRVADKARNPIALFQEQCLIMLQITPEYRMIIDNKDTPLQVFRIRVYVKGVRMATGLGSSTKAAKQDAAVKAMRKWPERYEQLLKL